MIDEAMKNAILEKFPDAKVLIAGDVEIVVKPPGRAEAKRFRTLGMDERRRDTAAETLLRDCCLYPDAKGVNELLEKKPFIAEAFLDQLLQLGGAVQETTVRNLSGA